MEAAEKIQVVNYTDDTQQMWWAIEPELAGDDDTGGEDTEALSSGNRMTRKGLAFLASLNWNVEWWKNYPLPDDPEHGVKMLRLNGVDTWATRRLLTELGDRMDRENVRAQYQQAMDAYPALLDMHREGLPVNDALRVQRIELLDARKDQGSLVTKEIALKYIVDNDVAGFRKMKKCMCCGGGKVAAKHCWRCSGLPGDHKKMKKKELLDMMATHMGIGLPDKFKRKDAVEYLRECAICKATGKVATYDFNPFSPPQMKKLLYDVIGIPRHTFKNKVMMDEDAMKKILRWAKT